MIGHELAVEQHGPRLAQRRNQPGQCYFGSIGTAAEHRFAAEHPVKPDAVETADQLALLPALDRMGDPAAVQFDIAGLDPARNPGLALVAARRGAFRDHAFESAVAGHFESTPSQHFGQRMRAMKMIEREDRAAARLNPEHLGIRARVGHRKDPGAIGQEQDLGIERRLSLRSVHELFLVHCQDQPKHTRFRKSSTHQSPAG